ncbi:hypothetical protein [Streptomyces sp. NPDC002082]|uniref:hypothetical protein n=1 Tax=Streptomyces sp. NPDC002082 TaxID=3154772 RepID=UPI00333263D0
MRSGRTSADAKHRPADRGPREAVDHLDGLHHDDFELAVRDLMHRDGCAELVRVRVLVRDG